MQSGKLPILAGAAAGTGDSAWSKKKTLCCDCDAPAPESHRPANWKATGHTCPPSRPMRP